MDKTVLRQHIVNTLGTLQDLARNAGDEDASFALELAKSSLSRESAQAPTAGTTLAAAATERPSVSAPAESWDNRLGRVLDPNDFPNDYELRDGEDEWDEYDDEPNTRQETVVPEGFNSQEEVREFARAQGLSEEEISKLSNAVDNDTEEVLNTFTPDIVGNLTDEQGNITGSVGSPEASIAAANEMLADDEAEGNPYADAWQVDFIYARADEQELTEDQVRIILDAPVSRSLKSVMGDFMLVNTLPGDEQFERRATLLFPRAGEGGTLAPGAVLSGIAAYRGVATIPGIGTVSVRTQVPDDLWG